MPREPVSRTRAAAPDPSGLDEFAEETTSNPSRQRVTKEVTEDSSFGRGWSSGKQAPQYKSSKNTERFTVPDNGEEVLVKFAEDVPFVSFFQHWIMQEDGKKHPYAHLTSECPLCAYGDRAKSVDYFNVLKLGENGEPELVCWIATPDPAAAIADRANSKRTSPLNREDLYFAVSKRRQNNGVFAYTVDPVKASELQEEWGIDPLTAEQIAKATETLYDESVAANQRKTRPELLEIAKKYMGD